MQTVVIGDASFNVYEECPEDWSMENDYIHDVHKLGEHVYRITWWTGRVLFAVEFFGKTLALPLQSALTISRLIASDEQARRGIVSDH